MEAYITREERYLTGHSASVLAYSWISLVQGDEGSNRPNAVSCCVCNISKNMLHTGGKITSMYDYCVVDLVVHLILVFY